MAVCQNLVPLVNIKIAGKWMFIPLKMVLIGIDPYPYEHPNFDFSYLVCSGQVSQGFDPYHGEWECCKSLTECVH